MRLTYKYKKESGYGSVKMKDLPPDPLITKLEKLSYLDKVWDEQRNKLGQLEDIEDELGIDLITLFKALNNPIYIKENFDGALVEKTLWCSNCIICGFGEPIIKVGDYAVYPKDYCKTWALTKEELL